MFRVEAAHKFGERMQYGNLTCSIEGCHERLQVLVMSESNKSPVLSLF